MNTLMKVAATPGALGFVGASHLSREVKTLLIIAASGKHP